MLCLTLMLFKMDWKEDCWLPVLPPSEIITSHTHINLPDCMSSGCNRYSLPWLFPGMYIISHRMTVCVSRWSSTTIYNKLTCWFHSWTASHHVDIRTCEHGSTEWHTLNAGSNSVFHDLWSCTSHQGVPGAQAGLVPKRVHWYCNSSIHFDYYMYYWMLTIPTKKSILDNVI